MKYEQINISDKTCFDLKQIFECGQCFRWKKEEDGSYTGVVSIGVLNVKKQNATITICGYIKNNINLKEFCDEYFDIQCDYKKIQKEISKDDCKIYISSLKIGHFQYIGEIFI